MPAASGLPADVGYAADVHGELHHRALAPFGGSAGAEARSNARRLIDLERALSHEVSRRGDLEVWVSKQVDLQVRAVASSAADVVERRATEAQRQLAGDLRGRLSAVELELGSLRTRLRRVETTAEHRSAAAGARPLRGEAPDGAAAAFSSAFEPLGRRTAAASVVEERLSALERRVEKPLEKLPGDAAWQIQQLCQPFIEEGTAKYRGVAERALAETEGNFERIKALETWCTEVVTPELLRLSAAIAAAVASVRHGAGAAAGAAAVARGGAGAFDGGVRFSGAGALEMEAEGGPLYARRLEQRKSALAEAFDVVDVDGNGFLDREEIAELVQHRQTAAGGRSPSSAASIFASLDDDGDGQISKSEFCTHFAKNLPADDEEFSVEVAGMREAAQAIRDLKLRLKEQLQGVDLSSDSEY